MKQTIKEAAREAIHKHYNCNGTYPSSEREYCEHCNGHNTAFDCCECGADEFKEGFITGADWQAKQSPWISVEEQLPEENENIIIMCKHGAIFNGTYCNGVWFCMDGYINDIYKDSPIYTSMSSIPPLWEPVAWFPIPSFDEILEANKDVLERIKEKGD